MDTLNYHAIHKQTGKRAIYQEDFDRLAGKYMETIASPNTTDQQKEIAMLNLGELNRNTYVDQSFSGAPVKFTRRPMGQS